MFPRFSGRARAIENSLFRRAEISALNGLRHGIAAFTFVLPRQYFFHVSSEPPPSNLQGLPVNHQRHPRKHP